MSASKNAISVSNDIIPPPSANADVQSCPIRLAMGPSVTTKSTKNGDLTWNERIYSA